MNPEEIIKLARVKKMSKKELEETLAGFKKENWRIIECILFIRQNQFIGMNESVELLFNHKDWAADAEGYYKHQEDMLREAFKPNS